MWNPSPTRDVQANSFITAFDFSRPPRKPIFIPFAREVSIKPWNLARGVIYTAYGAALVFATLVLAGVRLADPGARKRLSRLQLRHRSMKL